MKDNPPAFPLPNINQPGMTLRDWFAGQALIAMGEWTPYRADGTVVCDPSEQHRIRSQYAYGAADAMLEARKTKP